MHDLGNYSNLNSTYICKLKFFRNILLIVLSLQSIVPTSWLQDILRLPVFIAHYFHHQHGERHIHFTDFVSEHYFNKDHHDQDHDEHQNLPFHHHDCDLHHFNSFVAIQEPFYAIPFVSTNNKRNKIASEQHFHFRSSFSSIWRPPKFA